MAKVGYVDYSRASPNHKNNGDSYTSGNHNPMELNQFDSQATRKINLEDLKSLLA